jgi:hypothetical protein
MIPLTPTRIHLLEQLWRILEIGVDDHHCITAGVFEPGGRRDLLAEVPRQPEATHTRVSRAQLVQQHCGIVAAAIIDVDELEPRVRDLSRDLAEPPVRLRTTAASL